MSAIDGVDAVDNAVLQAVLSGASYSLTVLSLLFSSGGDAVFNAIHKAIY